MLEATVKLLLIIEEREARPLAAVRVAICVCPSVLEALVTVDVSSYMRINSRYFHDRTVIFPVINIENRN